MTRKKPLKIRLLSFDLVKDEKLLEEKENGLHYEEINKDGEILKDVHLTKFLLRYEHTEINENASITKRTYVFRIYKCINGEYSENSNLFEYEDGKKLDIDRINTVLDNSIRILHSRYNNKQFKNYIQDYISLLVKKIPDDIALINTKNREIVKKFIRSFIEILKDGENDYIENRFDEKNEEYLGYFEYNDISSNKDLYLSIRNNKLSDFVPSEFNIPSKEYKKQIIGYKERKRDNEDKLQITCYCLSYKSWYNLVLDKEKSDLHESFKKLQEDVLLEELSNLGILRPVKKKEEIVCNTIKDIKERKYNIYFHYVKRSKQKDCNTAIIILDVKKMYKIINENYIEKKIEPEPQISDNSDDTSYPKDISEVIERFKKMSELEEKEKLDNDRLEGFDWLRNYDNGDLDD